MRRTPTSEHATKDTTPQDAPAPGATDVIEAATAEEALGLVHERLGAHARIVDARRVRRGGVAGFFAREVVQMHAAPGGDATAGGSEVSGAAGVGPGAAAPSGDPLTVTTQPSPTHPAPGPETNRPAPAQPAGAGAPTADGRAPIDRVLAEARSATDATDFATFLREQLGSGELEHEAALAGAVSGLAANGRAADGSGHEHAVNGSVNGHTANGSVNGHGANGSVGDGHGLYGRLASGYGRDAAATNGASTTGRDGAAHPAGASGASPWVWPSLTPAEAAADHLVVGRSVRPGQDDDEPTSRHDDASDDDAATVEEGAPAWSAATLIRLGLPPELVRSIEVQEPGDDLAWTYGLTNALRSLCRPLPTGRSLLVGPRARGLASRLGISMTRVGEPLRVRGDAAAAVNGGAAGQAWLERVGRHRWLHVVAGGARWRELLHRDPLAISWADSASLTEAVRCAYELGLVLGYGPQGTDVMRARPLDVALAVRELVPRG